MEVAAYSTGGQKAKASPRRLGDTEKHKPAWLCFSPCLCGSVVKPLTFNPRPYYCTTSGNVVCRVAPAPVAVSTTEKEPDGVVFGGGGGGPVVPPPPPHPAIARISRTDIAITPRRLRPASTRARGTASMDASVMNGTLLPAGGFPLADVAWLVMIVTARVALA